MKVIGNIAKMISNNLLIVRISFVLIGIALIATGFNLFYNYRKFSKILIGAIAFAIGIILFFYGIGIISPTF